MSKQAHPSVITQLLAARGILANGVTLTTEWAGEVLTPVGGKDDVPCVPYLYGPGRKTPAEAKLDTLALPAELPVGKYTLKVQRQGEGDTTYLLINFVVVPLATGSLTVNLFNDNDGDGTFDPAEKYTGQRPIVLTPPDGKPISNNTNSAGSLTFERLVAGEHQVRRMNYPPGYVCSNPEADADGNIKVTILAGKSVTVNIGTKTAKATDGDPLPPKTPGNSTDSGTTSRIIKAAVGGTSVAPDAVVRRLDGSKTTYAALSRDVWQNTGERVWYSISRGEKPDAKKFDGWEKWAMACGVDTVIVCFTPDEGSGYVPTPEETTAFFTAAAPMLTGRKVKFIAELGNEPNEKRYWASRDMAVLVRVFINPAVKILQPAGIETIGASVTYSVAALKQLVDAGMATTTIGFHPYRKSASTLKALLSEAGDATGDKLLDLTEWNDFEGENVRAWKVLQQRPECRKEKDDDTNTAMQKYDERAEMPARSPDQVTASQREQWAVMKANPRVRYVCYYVVTMSKETATSPLALLTKNADGTYSETVYSRDFWAVAQ